MKLSFKNQYRLGYHIFTCPGLRHRCKLVPPMLDWLVQPVANQVTWLAGPASQVQLFQMYCMCVFLLKMDAIWNARYTRRKNYLTWTHFSAGAVTTGGLQE